MFTSGGGAHLLRAFAISASSSAPTASTASSPSSAFLVVTARTFLVVGRRGGGDGLSLVRQFCVNGRAPRWAGCRRRIGTGWLAPTLDAEVGGQGIPVARGGGRRSGPGRGGRPAGDGRDHARRGRWRRVVSGFGTERFGEGIPGIVASVVRHGGFQSLRGSGHRAQPRDPEDTRTWRSAGSRMSRRPGKAKAPYRPG